jgi:hypothetical protein
MWIGQNASARGHFSMGCVLHQVAPEPTITLMKSRRRIALAKVVSYAD